MLIFPLKKQWYEKIKSDIEIVNGKDTDLQIDRRVYAIHLSDVSEVQ